MAKRDLERVGGAVAVDMTPMIDCTFNLLIFFLCNINFRALEGKLPCFLPKDVGIGGPIVRELAQVEVSVARLAAANVRDPTWTWRFADLVVRVQGRVIETARELFETIEPIRRADPETVVLLRPRPGTLYIDAVKVLDELLRAGCTGVRVSGTPMRE